MPYSVVSKMKLVCEMLNVVLLYNLHSEIVQEVKTCLRLSLHLRYVYRWIMLSSVTFGSGFYYVWRLRFL